MAVHGALRRKVVLWFIFIIAAVLLAGWVGFRQLSEYIVKEANRQMAAKVDHIDDVLEATNSIYLDLTKASMRVLRLLAQSEGTPALGIGLEGEPPPLQFGTKIINGNFTIVDEVQRMVGGTATFFVKSGPDFVRVSTNVTKSDGSRAVGTVLDPNGKAFAAISKGEAYYGLADILGKPFITGYEPIRDEQGNVIGVYYVGYALETLSTLRDSIEEHSPLENGFFALVAPGGKITFQTKGIEHEEEVGGLAEAAASNKPVDGDWLVKTQVFSPWNYTIVAATYLPDVTQLTMEILWQVYGIGSIIILAVLIASFWLASRLSDALTSAETSRQEALAARDAAESANRTKSTFLANMSHELRTPMNAIIGYSEMLIEEAEDLDLKEMIPDLQKIRSAGKHLLALINDILDLSKIEAGKMTLFLEDFPIEPMIRDVVSTIMPLVEKNENRIIVECPPEIGSMKADLTKVRQTLFNLLSNASKFTEKGEITLTVQKVDHPTGSRLKFSVKDTGIGMNEEQLGKLFQSFSQADASTTRKYGGTGLGLVISRKFCQMMGGDITVQSQSGAGTTFTVDLPEEVIETTPETPREQGAVKTSGASKLKLVLVIDDDHDSADILKRNLMKSGYEVVVAHSGTAGLEIARKMKPAAITLDVMMPGMDGWSVLTSLKADPATANIPVIMVTMLQDRQLGFTLGASEFLTKPVHPEKLRGLLSKYCGEPASLALVIEDDPGNRQLLTRLLEKEHIRVVEAENGSVAMERLATEKPAIILLDLMMPVMDGFEFLALLRQNPKYADIPVIVVTAKDLTQNDRELLTGSVTQIIEKGAVNRDKLLRDITQMLAKSENKR